VLGFVKNLDRNVVHRIASYGVSAGGALNNLCSDLRECCRHLRQSKHGPYKRDYLPEVSRHIHCALQAMCAACGEEHLGFVLGPDIVADHLTDNRRQSVFVGDSRPLGVAPRRRTLS